MSEQKWDSFILGSIEYAEEWMVSKGIDTLHQWGLVKHFLKFPPKNKNKFLDNVSWLVLPMFCFFS